MDALDQKLLDLFPGKVVRKDLIGPLKGQLNVPTYVLEYLLGKYCSSSDDEVIESGLEEVRRILSENYVRPDQSEVFKSQVRERGQARVIDKVKVRLTETEDKYWAELANLQLTKVNIAEEWVNRYEKLLAGGIWAIIDLEYRSDIFHQGQIRPFVITQLRPIQLATASLEEIRENRSRFAREEWINVLIRSLGFEPSALSERLKLLLLCRLIPLVENNFNFVELGPRGTGKSYVFREISPYSILVSGGETTVPNLFVSNIGRGKIGLVGLWDVVAFDEVAGLKKLSSAAAVQILKDYMESGSFSRGREEITALASLVFIGNIGYDIETAVRTSHLFTPFPQEMQDLALLDRFHMYLPGWEIPKMHSSLFGSHFGFVVDYLAEFFKDSRKLTYATALDKYFQLGNALNKRDEKAVRKIVSGLIKLLHPDESYAKEDIEEYLNIGMEMRRRVKEQLKKMGGVEYWDTAFSYIEDSNERIVRVPEQSSIGMIPVDQQSPGVVYTVGIDMDLDKISLFRVEVGVMRGSGKYNVTGVLSKAMKEAIRTAYDYLRAHITKFAIEKTLSDYDVHVQVVNLMQAKEGTQTGVAFFIGILSALLSKPVSPGTVVLGEMSIHGAMLPVNNLPDCIQVVKENGGKRVLVPLANAKDVSSVPPDILRGLDVGFYADPSECVVKAMGM
ncbi:MAG: protease Lon-related BREX system protein BrxL [Actinobacteria bacterium]|nr:protease Lon-related BREX system protein BrxL [Actinomycetota bacterium]